MVGEIWDYESADLFVEAALTGHMVLIIEQICKPHAALERLAERGSP